MIKKSESVIAGITFTKGIINKDTILNNENYKLIKKNKLMKYEEY